MLERERQLDYRLRAADLSAYDYVLIDSPPALNVLSINILIASTDLIIPIEPHPLSLMVLGRLFETVGRNPATQPSPQRARVPANQGPPLVAPRRGHAHRAGRAVPGAGPVAVDPAVGP